MPRLVPAGTRKLTGTRPRWAVPTERMFVVRSDLTNSWGGELVVKKLTGCAALFLALEAHIKCKNRLRWPRLVECIVACAANAQRELPRSSDSLDEAASSAGSG